MSESEKPMVRFELIAWALSPIVAVILYVLTWPPIDILSSKSYSISSSGPRSRTGTLRLAHPWVSTIYWPLNVLRAANGKGNVLERYYDWWRMVLKK